MTIDPDHGRAGQAKRGQYTNQGLGFRWRCTFDPTVIGTVWSSGQHSAGNHRAPKCCGITKQVLGLKQRVDVTL